MKIDRRMTSVSRLLCLTALTLPLTMFAPSVQGQDLPKVQEPEYANSFYSLDSAGALTALEREPVGAAGRVKAFGFGGMEANYEIQNEHSPIRFTAGTPLQIVVKLENHDVDPATVVLLYPLTVKKGKRQLLMTGVGFMGTHSKSDMQTKQTQMVFTKYGHDSLKIAPAAPLAPGEYAISVQGKDQHLTAYCFGVDAAK